MTHFYAAVWQRFKYFWWFKAAGTCAFMVLFFYIYFAILHSPAYPARVMPITAIDSAIPFQAVWFYAYASLWVYTSIVPALMATVYRLLEYGIFIALLCVLGFATFYFFPTILPYNASDWGNQPLLHSLRALDTAGNVFPSLHVASAVFTALSLKRLLKEMAAPKSIYIVNIVWCCLIIYSTLAIKQHVIWDVLGGWGLAVVLHLCYAVWLKRGKQAGVS